MTALAGMLLSPSKGEAAAIHTITFDAVGGDKGDLKVNKGDTVVFKNALPLTPLTGAVAPVNLTFGSETVQVGAVPVARTITHSTSYSGTYAVAGLVPTTHSTGTITVANDSPPPPPPPDNPPPDNPPDQGGGNPPPGIPGGGGTGPNIPPGGPGNAPGGAGTANGPQLGSGTVNGQTPGSAGLVPAPVAAPKSGGNTTLGPADAARKQRALANAGAMTGGLGLTAMLGAILLLGVGIALARTCGRLGNSAATAPR